MAENSPIEADWRAVQGYFNQALYEEAYLDDTARTQLTKNFWGGMSTVLQRNEAADPGVTGRVFVRAEAISDEVRAVEAADFAIELAHRRGKAFLHGLFDPFAQRPLDQLYDRS